VTTNPAIGIGVGIAVQAATDEAVKRLMKRLHSDQQIAIATTAGDLAIGDTRPWSVQHTLPVENGHGDVRVLREFTSALATCREFAFSVAGRQWLEVGSGGTGCGAMGQFAITVDLFPANASCARRVLAFDHQRQRMPASPPRLERRAPFKFIA
jgi:hypothetical protein